MNKDKNGWLKKTKAWMIILANEVGRNKQIKGEKIMTIFQEKELL